MVEIIFQYLDQFFLTVNSTNFSGILLQYLLLTVFFSFRKKIFFQLSILLYKYDYGKSGFIAYLSNVFGGYFIFMQKYPNICCRVISLRDSGSLLNRIFFRFFNLPTRLESKYNFLPITFGIYTRIHLYWPLYESLMRRICWVFWNFVTRLGRKS